jgi:hypothetical protein
MPQRQPVGYVSALCSVALSTILLAPAGVAAQSRTLFSTDDGSGRVAGLRATGDLMIVRARQATADLTVLAAGGSETAVGFSASRPAARSIDLNLFADVDVTALVDHVEIVSPVGFAWVGDVAGADGSQVILAVAGGVLTGTVKLSGRTYSVRKIDASYQIAEINTAVVPGDEIETPRGVVGAGQLPLAEAARSTALAASSESGDAFDLLLYYTTAVKSAAGGTGPLNSLIAASIAEVNAAYAASGVSMRVRLVGALELAYADSGSTATDLEALGANPEVRAARDRYGADVVSLLVLRDPTSSGRGYVTISQGMVFPDFAYNVVVHYANAGYILSLAHELGHTFGCLHEAGNNGGDDTLGAFPYSLGYTDAAHGFHDLMSYGSGCRNCIQLNQFSSPVTTFQGVPVGTGAQDSARTINNTRAIVANYRPAAGDAGVPDAPTALTASVSGSTVSLAWSAPLAGTPTAYVIEAGSASGLANLASFSTNSPATTFTASGVALGTYYVRLRATNAAGTSGASNEVTVIVR